MKQIRLNAFEMNTVGHQSPGLWAHPRDRSASYSDLDYWTGLARILERGRFDGIFLADVLGVYDVYCGSPDAALRHAVQVPVGDPMLLVPAMAAVTEHLGFGVTCTLSYEPPYTLARRLSTLDHLTRGRAGWNIVTGYLDSAATGMGLAVQPRHDQRYDIADEYMQVMYQLWEGSWEEGAAVRDRARRRIRRPGQGPPGAPRGAVLPRRCDPSMRAVAAAHPGAVPGRRLEPRPRFRRGACRMRLHQRPIGAGRRAAGRRSAPPRRRARPQSRPIC